MKRSPLRPGKPLVRKTPMKLASFSRAGAPLKRMRMKSSQRSVTAAEKLLWDRLASLGCIACLKDGVHNPLVSIHHIDGRTKPGCHKLVLPLCAGHHQDGTGPDKSLIAVHPWKTQFETRYGSQMDLLAECKSMLGSD
jgi:hypothetical protein